MGPVGLLIICTALVGSLHTLTIQAAQSRSRPTLREQSAVSREGLDDEVIHLPGWGVPYDPLYSGYITVDKSAGRELFYLLAEASPEAPDDAPLLLWLNGGPGCSSVGGGFLSELGPYLPLPGGHALKANDYSWHHAAHVLFVESPAFVGFSFSRTPEDAVVGDVRTAQDLRIFLLRFLQRFPGMASRRLYISGESYAGHYVPGLAWEIVQGNRRAEEKTLDAGYLPLTGAAVGNPWTDAAMDNLGAVDYWWSHAIISDQTALGIKDNCNFTRIGPLDNHPQHTTPFSKADLCDKFCNRAMDELGPINIYHIYADMCTEPRVARVAAALAWAASGSAAGAAGQTLGASAASNMLQMLDERASRKAPASGPLKSEDVTPFYDPCVGDEVDTYLNLPAVQKALHANQTYIIPGRWTDCTRKITYSRADLLSSMLPIWRELLSAGPEDGIRYLIYSGDVDGIVPVIGTRRWVRSLNLKERAPWRPYMAPASDSMQGPQVGGYVVEYGLQCPTVHAPAVHPVEVTLPGTEAAASRRSLRAVTEQAGGADMGGAAAPAAHGKCVRDSTVTFATVRGSGHMVPYSQPVRALHLMRAFLAEAPL